MKNLADDIIEIINYLRPLNDQIKRDKIFNNPSFGYLLDIKEGGIEYLKIILMVIYLIIEEPILYYLLNK